MTREIGQLQAVEQYLLYKNSDPPPRQAPSPAPKLILRPWHRLRSLPAKIRKPFRRPPWTSSSYSDPWSRRIVPLLASPRPQRPFHLNSTRSMIRARPAIVNGVPDASPDTGRLGRSIALLRSPPGNERLKRRRKPDRLRGPTAAATADLHHVRERRAARDFNFAARAIGRECQLDGTAKFMRNEIADEA
jgi:hypothetical protein